MNWDSETIVNFPTVTASKWQSWHLNLIVWLQSSKSQHFILSTGHPKEADTSPARKTLICLISRATQLPTLPSKRSPPGHFLCEGMGIYLTSECRAPLHQPWPHGFAFRLFIPLGQVRQSPSQATRTNLIKFKWGLLRGPDRRSCVELNNWVVRRFFFYFAFFVVGFFWGVLFCFPRVSKDDPDTFHKAVF